MEGIMEKNTSKYFKVVERVIEEIRAAVVGKEEVIHKVLMALLADGHVLIDDIPGVGKTTLALAVSKVLGIEQNRIQCTPDILPSDITGFTMYDRKSERFLYYPGPVMCNLLMADEINRTSPKTQSALLEAMEEKKVTIDGETKELPKPFFVLATQNPSGSAGTHKLPDSQVDRFMICLSMGYPTIEEEIRIAKGKYQKNVLDNLQVILGSREILFLQDRIREIFIHDTVYLYMIKLISATRNSEYIERGISPRGTVALTKYVKAKAFFAQREYVTPEDVMSVFHDIGDHRIILNSTASGAQMTPYQIIEGILKSVESPLPQNNQGSILYES
jgi:MoxR-like ATPase